MLVWDLNSRSLRARLKGHKGTVRTLAFAPDGATLATGSEDGEVKLWETASGRERATLSGHSDMVTCLAFSPGGAILATGSLDTTVKLWEVNTGRERSSLQGHRDGVSALAFAPGARQMATGGFDGSVRLWEPAAPIFSPAACLAYSGEARSLAFSPDGRTLRAAGKAGVARWDVTTGSTLTTAGKGGTTAIATAPVGASHATGQPDDKVRPAVAFSPDGRFLASAQPGGDVVLWDARGGRQLGLLKGHRDLVRRGRFLARRPLSRHGRQGPDRQALEPGHSPADGAGHPQGGPHARLVGRLLARRQDPGRRRRSARYARHGHALGPGREEGEGDTRRARAGRRHGRLLARRNDARLGKLGRHHPDLGYQDRRASGTS